MSDYNNTVLQHNSNRLYLDFTAPHTEDQNNLQHKRRNTSRDVYYYANSVLTGSCGSFPLETQKQKKDKKTQRAHVSPPCPYTEMNKSGRRDEEQVRERGDREGEGEREGGDWLGPVIPPATALVNSRVLMLHAVSPLTYRAPEKVSARDRRREGLKRKIEKECADTEKNQGASRPWKGSSEWFSVPWNLWWDREGAVLRYRENLKQKLFFSFLLSHRGFLGLQKTGTLKWIT